MRVRKVIALVGAVSIFGICWILYVMINVSSFSINTAAIQDFHENSWVHVENKKIISTPSSELRNEYESHKRTQLSSSFKNEFIHFPVQCSLEMKHLPQQGIKMSEVYKELRFDNIDGGVWKQGWSIEIEPGRWNRKKKLKVFVVPHSHNDPGWIKTFEDYYQTQTKKILDNMVVKLSENERRKFIWAEVSFLSRWWEDLTDDVKEAVKRLVANGQLEIVTGGWVMNDEANTHVFAMLMQMIEGHEWLIQNIGIIPRNSWSIDPFGQSPSMAYLLKRMHFQNLVLQRIHYSIKKYLASNKYLEFFWRQLWDSKGTTELLTHVMPFYSYDIPHTCGPDPKICCQFDFRRLPGHGLSCPWHSPPQIITKENVAYRSHILLDQYQKKAQLYQTDVLLVPLGDDFRYDSAMEWDFQYNNYQRIFDYLNNNTNLNVQIQFGTLSDFFSALRNESSSQNLPYLYGDFFTYSDRDDHYWSGYYTSRPFYKKMDRNLIHYVRAADILFTFASSNKNQDLNWQLTDIRKIISKSRRALSLFQHHDGITGTAKDFVVQDYAEMMIQAIRGLQQVIQLSTYMLLSESEMTYDKFSVESSYFDLDDLRKRSSSLPEKTVVSVETPRKIVIYNSLLKERHELVTVRVSMPYVKITDSNGNRIITEVHPAFLHSFVVAENYFDVSFVVNISPLSLKTYYIKSTTVEDYMRYGSIGNITLLNYNERTLQSSVFKNLKTFNSGKDFSLQNSHLIASFNHQGFLKAVLLKHESITVPLHLEFRSYSARETRERSGAYLFLPDGPSKPLIFKEPALIRIVEGSLLSFVDVNLPEVRHHIRVYDTKGADSLGVEIHNLVDIADKNNYELAMRISSNIKNQNEFFTDLNGLQIIRRQFFPKLPLQANFYPMPSHAFIEDNSIRLSLISAQPLGIGSLQEGQIEVIQDRRLNQDDNLGLGQGVTDNVKTINSFRLIVEKRIPKCQSVDPKNPFGLASHSAQLSSNSLLYPLIRLIWLGKFDNSIRSDFKGARNVTYDDIHLLMLRSSKKHSGLILHRQIPDSCFQSSNWKPSSGQVNISNLLDLNLERISETSLSFVDKIRTLPSGELYNLCPMEMAAFQLFSRS